MPKAKKNTTETKTETANKIEELIFVKVKFEQKNQFKTFFPEAIWNKGKGWAIKDTLANQNKLEEWQVYSKGLEAEELTEAVNKITEGLKTIVKKIEELDTLIKKGD